MIFSSFVNYSLICKHTQFINNYVVKSLLNITPQNKEHAKNKDR